jgi:hypothetical protein
MTKRRSQVCVTAALEALRGGDGRRKRLRYNVRIQRR